MDIVQARANCFNTLINKWSATDLVPADNIKTDYFNNLGVDDNYMFLDFEVLDSSKLNIGSDHSRVQINCAFYVNLYVNTSSNRNQKTFLISKIFDIFHEGVEGLKFFRQTSSDTGIKDGKDTARIILFCSFDKYIVLE